MFDDLPVWPAYALTVVVFLGLGGVGFLVPRDRIFEGAPDGARWRDIRIWAVLLVLVQLALYWVFS